MATRMQQRRGTAAEWTAANPVLAAGEIGFETDTGKFKFGDGINTWSNLNAFADASAIIDAAPETLDTLNELAAAINDDPNFYTSVTDNATAIATVNSEIDTLTAQLNAADAQTLTNAQSYTDDAISTLGGTVTTGDATLQTNIDNLTTSTAAADAALAADILQNTGDIGTHTAATTNVHGIADTSQLETTSGAQIKADAAQAAAEATAEAYADSLASNYDAAGTASSTVATHNAVTTNVHGIADTSVLATDAEVASAVSTHAAVTTNVHGIADTSVLATNSDVSTAQSAAESFATTAVSNHNAVTTNVHGIADTSLLLTTGGGTLTGKLTLDGDPTQALHAVTKQYADSISEGLHIHSAVAAATTTNIDLTGGTFGGSMDGVTLSDGDRVLVKDQTAAADNGIYTYTATGATFTRATDFDSPTEVAGGDFVFVLGGTTYENTGWVQVTDAVTTIGTDPIEFSQFSGAGSVTGGTNIDVSGTQVSVVADPTFADATVTNLDITNLVFSDGTQTKAGVPSITPITEKTAAYTLSATTEKDTIIEVNSASAVTLTIPEDATVNFPVGSTLDVIQTGAGQVTIAGTGSAVVNGTPGTKLRTQWSSVTLLKRAANSWLVFGDTAA